MRGRGKIFCCWLMREKVDFFISLGIRSIKGSVGWYGS